MHRLALLLVYMAVLFPVVGAPAASLPFSTVFQGREKFDRLVAEADRRNWASLPIGSRTMAVGLAMVGTPYKSHTLEIDDHIEVPSVDLNGLDCWTFFEAALAFARMIEGPRGTWTPETLLRFIELDRYRGGRCTGEYLSRLHYLEDWAADNERRGLVADLTRGLGGVRANHVAQEMTLGWKGYRYLRNNPSLLPALKKQEERITAMPCYYIPKNRVRDIESKLRNGDIIGIWSHSGRGRIGTSHVGLAWRDPSGTLRFVHASSPHNFGRVVTDQRLSGYLNEFSSHAGIMVVRPLR